MGRHLEVTKARGPIGLEHRRKRVVEVGLEKQRPGQGGPDKEPRGYSKYNGKVFGGRGDVL